MEDNLQLELRGELVRRCPRQAEGFEIRSFDESWDESSFNCDKHVERRYRQKLASKWLWREKVGCCLLDTHEVNQTTEHVRKVQGAENKQLENKKNEDGENKRVWEIEVARKNSLKNKGVENNQARLKWTVC